MAASPFSSRLNRVVGPWLLRLGITVRSSLAALSDNPAGDHYLLDHLLLMPFARKLISVEVHNMAQAAEEGTKPFSFKTFAKHVVARVKGKKEYDSAVQDWKMTEHERRNARLKILEKFIRPVLVPNEMWSDVLRWRSMSHLKNWVRCEFLIAKYGADVREALFAYPQLRLSPQIEPMKYNKRILLKLLGMLPDGVDDRKTSLPSSHIIVKAFFMENWNTRKDKSSQLKRTTHLCSQLGGEVAVGGGLKCAQLPLDTDLSSLSFEDLLELSFGQVVGCGPFNALCEDAGIIQLWTKEYISGLASYLRKRSENFQGKTIILDTGADDGFLANALQEVLNSKRSRTFSKAATNDNSEPKAPLVIATDKGSWRFMTGSSVGKISAHEALAKYCGVAGQQVIVLCTWMPPGEDWTEFLRQWNVDEYILIGECDDGACGDNWATWGNPEFFTEAVDDIDASENVFVPPVPYSVDGYRRHELERLIPFHFSRLDTAFSRASSTVCFRRTGKQSK